MQEERGQTSAEFAGVRLVIGLVFAALIALGLAPDVAGAAKKAVCQIVNSTCAEAQEPTGEPPAQPPEGPAPIDFDLPFPVLPFPGDWPAEHPDSLLPGTPVAPDGTR